MPEHSFFYSVSWLLGHKAQAGMALWVFGIACAGQTPCQNLSQSDSIKSESSIGDQEWQQLFNGKNLDGWIPKICGYELGENWGNTFRVENELLCVRYDQYTAFENKFGHLFFKQPYSDYMLRIEYRFVGDQVAGAPGWAFRNSGVMIHGQEPVSMRKNQEFPVSIEVQLLGGNGQDERPNLNVCTPGTHIEMNGKLIREHCTNSTSKTCHGDDWVTAEIEVHGNRLIRHKIDGRVVLEYQRPQLDDSDRDASNLIAAGDRMLSSGSISLQSESHPIEFRKVELKRLPKE